MQCSATGFSAVLISLEAFEVCRWNMIQQALQGQTFRLDALLMLILLSENRMLIWPRGRERNTDCCFPSMTPKAWRPPKKALLAVRRTERGEGRGEKKMVWNKSSCSRRLAEYALRLWVPLELVSTSLWRTKQTRLLASLTTCRTGRKLQAQSVDL